MQDYVTLRNKGYKSAVQSGTHFHCVLCDFTYTDLYVYLLLL